MIIKTLEELKAAADAAKVEYAQQTEEAKKPIAASRAALAQAEDAMQAALESEDGEAYSKAKQTVEFERAKLTKLETAYSEPAPLYTDEQYTEYRRQIILAYNTEVKTLFEQLQAVLASGIVIVEQIGAKTKLNNEIVGSFNATIPTSDAWKKTNLLSGATSGGVTKAIKDVFRSGSAVSNSVDYSIQTCNRLINENAE